jgi:hypothetical protein
MKQGGRSPNTLVPNYDPLSIELPTITKPHDRDAVLNSSYATEDLNFADELELTNQMEVGVVPNNNEADSEPLFKKKQGKAPMNVLGLVAVSFFNKL